MRMNTEKSVVLLVFQIAHKKNTKVIKISEKSSDTSQMNHSVYIEQCFGMLL